MFAPALIVSVGCGPDYVSLQPSQVRVFKIPAGGTGTESDTTLCLLSVPAGYTPDHSFPLLVALHGGGSNAIAFHDLWRPVTQSNGFVLATPQGGERAPDGMGYLWGPNAYDSVRRSIDVILRTVNVDRSEIYLSGFSQGGHLTYALARLYPRVFTGIAPIGVGYDLPNATAARTLYNMRLYIGHGELEPGLEDVRGLVANLRAEGCDVQLAIYRGTGHGIPQPASSELERILRYLKDGEVPN
jgi:poly(3-hydroxybutyrate) depolymerase